MLKRGPKLRKLVDVRWNSNLAYAVGLIATDGCLARNTHLIDLSSKDKEQLKNFNASLGINLKIGNKKSGAGFLSWRVQLKNKLFYDFLISIGLTPAKSKTLSILKIPNKYFFDFLRGCFDGDGSFYSYWDKRWKNSFMFYLELCSASFEFIKWIQQTNDRLLGIHGHVTKGKTRSTYQLKYAKSEALKLIGKIYPSNEVICLTRKRLKIYQALDSMSTFQNARVVKLVDTLP